MHRYHLCILFALLALFTNAASAELYGSAFGGASFATDRFANSITDFDNAIDTDGFLTPEVTGFDANNEPILVSQPDFAIAPVVGIALGYDFSLAPRTSIRLEVEGSHRRHRDNVIGPQLFAEEVNIVNAITIRTGASATTAKLNVTTAMANVKVGRNLWSDRLKIYGGGGIGVAKIDYLIEQTSLIEISGSTSRIAVDQIADETLSVFSWQAIGGIEKPVSDRVKLFIEGRYFQTSEFEMNAPLRSARNVFSDGTSTPSGGVAPASSSMARFSTADVLFGVSVSLN